MVLFYVQSKLFCTDADFAPARTVPGMLEAVMRMGSQAGRLAGRYPPLEVYGWDDKGF